LQDTPAQISLGPARVFLRHVRHSQFEQRVLVDELGDTPVFFASRFRRSILGVVRRVAQLRLLSALWAVVQHHSLQLAAASSSRSLRSSSRAFFSHWAFVMGAAISPSRILVSCPTVSSHTL